MEANEAGFKSEKHCDTNEILFGERLRKQGSNVKEPETLKTIPNLSSNILLNRLNSKKENCMSVVDRSLLEDSHNPEMNSNKKQSRVAIVNNLARTELEKSLDKNENQSQSVNNYNDSTSEKQDVLYNHFIYSNNKENEEVISGESLLNKPCGRRSPKIVNGNRSTIKTKLKDVKHIVSEDIETDNQQGNCKHLIDSDITTRSISQVGADNSISKAILVLPKVGPEIIKTDIPVFTADNHTGFSENGNCSRGKLENIKDIASSNSDLSAHSIRSKFLSTGSRSLYNTIKYYPLEATSQQQQEEDLGMEESNLTNYLVLAHGKYVPKPIERLENANFCEDVLQELSQMQLTQIYRIQAYSWPHLMRGNSLLIVNPPRSGKTLAYLPAFCSIIKMKVYDNALPDGVGPIGIILATSSVEVEKMAQVCRRFFKNSPNHLSIVKAFGVRKTNKISAQLLNGCDILIATVPCLSRLLSDKIQLLDNKRIQHIVIDNIDLMHENLKPDLHTILRKCCSLNKENITTSVQLIISARNWNPYMSGFFKICKNPQLCIGSYLAAAVYARSKISVNLVKNTSKGCEILKFIEAHPYHKERLVIICNKDEEVKEIIEPLKSISATFAYCTSESSANEIEYTLGWHNQKYDKMSILVCTDSLLPKLNIRKAQNMISYSMPSSWTKFSLRFSVFLDYYEDLIQNETLSKPAASSLILLDENNNSQLPKLVEFLQEHAETKIPYEVLSLYKRMGLQREIKNISQMTELCPYLLDYGNCIQRSDCKMRHILTKFDTPDGNFPRNGLIKIKILNVISPIHYCVSLLEKKSIENGSTWIKVNQSENFLNFGSQFSKYFADSTNHQKHWPKKVGDLCVVIDSGMYHRCIIVNVRKSMKRTSSMDVNLRVKLVDSGIIISCRSSDILVLPEKFENFPYQAVDLHMVGIVPPDFEQEWDTNVTRTIQYWFDEYVNEENYVEATIKFSLSNRIWAENIRIVEKLNEVSSYAHVVNIQKSLLEGKYAVQNMVGIDTLQEMVFGCGDNNDQVYQNNSTSNSQQTSDESILMYEEENDNDTECDMLERILTNSLGETSELFSNENSYNSIIKNVENVKGATSNSDLDIRANRQNTFAVSTSVVDDDHIIGNTNLKSYGELMAVEHSEQTNKRAFLNTESKILNKPRATLIKNIMEKACAGENNIHSNTDLCVLKNEGFSGSCPNNKSIEDTDNKNISMCKPHEAALQEQCIENSSPKNQKDIMKTGLVKSVEEIGIQANLMKHLVLAHGRNVPKPIERLAKANFCDDVLRELSKMQLTEIYRIQAYSWPHLMRGNSLLIINPASSGKSLAYLPAFCSIIKMNVDDNAFPDGVGPIGIILATSSVEAEKIAQICSRFFNHSTNNLSIVTAYGVRNRIKIAAQLLNGCDILIATVPCLSRLLSDKIPLLDNKRIQHIVIDNMDLMPENHRPDLHNILRKCCSLNNECKATFVQLVITARNWNPYMSGFLKICKNPQLCIGSHLASAVYARLGFSVKFIKNSTRGYQILEYIQEHPYLSERLVIICSKDEEVKEVVDALTLISAIFAYCTSESTANEIECTLTWHNRKCGKMSILVCTDSILPELNIRKAQNMINYSLPTSWIKFNLRFSVFLDYYEDLIQNDTLSQAAASSLILLDENNNSQLPKLVEFLQEYGEAKIPHEVLNLYHRMCIQREMNNISRMTELCPYLIDYGNCIQRSDCKRRHILSKYDTPHENFPREGLIKIKILNVISPTHYYVSLLEKKSIENGSTWIKVNKSDSYLNFSIQFSKYFADSTNHQKHWPIKLGDLCVVFDSGMYHRCIIVYAKKPVKEVSSMNINLRVKLVDIGTIISCRSSNVLILPEEFKKIPYQTVDLHLVGIVPHDFEKEWDTNVIKTIRHWFDEYINDEYYVEAVVKLSLRNRILVENVRIVEKLKAESTYVHVIDIQKSLLEQEFAVSNTVGKDILIEMAFECGIINKPAPQYNSTSSSSQTSDESLIIYDNDTDEGKMPEHNIDSNFSV